LCWQREVALARTAIDEADKTLAVERSQTAKLQVYTHTHTLSLSLFLCLSLNPVLYLCMCSCFPCAYARASSRDHPSFHSSPLLSFPQHRCDSLQEEITAVQSSVASQIAEQQIFNQRQTQQHMEETARVKREYYALQEQCGVDESKRPSGPQRLALVATVQQMLQLNHREGVCVCVCV
jgi:hypothetical protein